MALGAAFGGSLGVTASSGPGIDLKAETIGLGGGARAADGDRRRAARRPLDRHAHQDRAGRPDARDVRPPRRVAAADRRGLHARPVLRRRHRGGADRREVPHAGDPAHGHLPRQLVRAVAAAGRAPRCRRSTRASPPSPTAPTAPSCPYLRDENLARPWAVPGTPGLRHRIGGLEKEDGTGNISYEPANHALMTRLRAEKVAKVADEIPPLEVDHEDGAEVLVLGWGSSYGTIRARRAPRAARRARRWPPRTCATSTRCRRTSARCCAPTARCVVPEMNMGQLVKIIRAEFLVDADSVTKVEGLPFFADELEAEILERVDVSSCSRDGHGNGNGTPCRCSPRRTSPPTRRRAGARAAGTTRSSPPSSR